MPDQITNKYDGPVKILDRNVCDTQKLKKLLDVPELFEFIIGFLDNSNNLELTSKKFNAIVWRQCFHFKNIFLSSLKKTIEIHREKCEFDFAFLNRSICHFSEWFCQSPSVQMKSYIKNTLKVIEVQLSSLPDDKILEVNKKSDKYSFSLKKIKMYRLLAKIFNENLCPQKVIQEIEMQSKKVHLDYTYEAKMIYLYDNFSISDIAEQLAREGDDPGNINRLISFADKGYKDEIISKAARIFVDGGNFEIAKSLVDQSSNKDDILRDLVLDFAEFRKEFEV